MRIFKRLYSKWSNMKPLSFILTTVILNFILLIPVLILLIYLEVPEEEIGGIEYDNWSFWGLFLTAVFLAPLIETWTGQSLPIKFIQKIFGKKFEMLAVFTSAVMFSLMHFGYSIWYALITLPMGILLAETYIIFQNRKESSFWITYFVHSVRNLVAVVAIFNSNS